MKVHLWHQYMSVKALKSFKTIWAKKDLFYESLIMSNENNYLEM